MHRKWLRSKTQHEVEEIALFFPAHTIHAPRARLALGSIVSIDDGFSGNSKTCIFDNRTMSLWSGSEFGILITIKHWENTLNRAIRRQAQLEAEQVAASITSFSLLLIPQFDCLIGSGRKNNHTRFRVEGSVHENWNRVGDQRKRLERKLWGSRRGNSRSSRL